MVERVVPVLGLVVVLLLAACGGGGSPLTLSVTAESGEERLDDLGKLDYRVYTVNDVDEIIAEATNPNGTPVSGVSCETIAIAAPEATDCREREQRVLRDVELVAEGDVPASGSIEIDDRSGRVRVYIDLPADQLEIDEHGHLCRWGAIEVIDADTETTRIDVLPNC